MSDPQNSFQISNERYLFYSQNFGDAADAGIVSSRKIYDAISVISRVNFSSFSQHIDTVNATNTLINAIVFSYELSFSEAHSIYPMRDAFADLATHIRNWTGKTLDQYLTDEGILVNQTYANIANVYSGLLSTSEKISAGNIE